MIFWFGSAAIAMLIERLIGYPRFLQDTIRHPVQWIGALIDKLDKSLNNQNQASEKQKLFGILAVIVIILSAAIPAFALQWLLVKFPLGWFVNALLATTLIAQKSLRDHVLAVANGLGISLETARIEIAKIVGRDPSGLNETGISKAALESLAENTSDGIVAPVFWYALFGLPGITVYKAINTADSMIGHKTERHLHFGWAAAKLDDLINLPASRLTGGLFAASAWINSAGQGKASLQAMWRDASKHSSPNAGWPEAAMAGALGLRFGGPRTYDSEAIDLAWMGDGAPTMDRRDIARGIDLYDTAMLMLTALMVVLATAL